MMPQRGHALNSALEMVVFTVALRDDHGRFTDGRDAGVVLCACGLPFHSFCTGAGRCWRRQRLVLFGGQHAGSQSGTNESFAREAEPAKKGEAAEEGRLRVDRTAPPCRVPVSSEPAHAGGVCTAPSAKPSDGFPHPERDMRPLSWTVGSERVPASRTQQSQFKASTLALQQQVGL